MMNKPSRLPLQRRRPKRAGRASYSPALLITASRITRAT
jgi:hypothetical protein